MADDDITNLYKLKLEIWNELGDCAEGIVHFHPSVQKSSCQRMNRRWNNS
jgi:hypothetical protein